MRREAALADRHRAVQQAAADWAAAGAIPTAALAAIRTAFPDDRQRLGWVLRGLLLVFTWLAISTGEGMVGAIVEPGDHSIGPLLLAAGICLAILAEILTGPVRLAGFGVDDAVELAALGELLAGLVFLFHENLDLTGEATTVPVLLAAAALGAAAAWRYGGIVFGAVTAAGLFGFLAQLPAGRLLWILAGALLGLVLGRASRSPALAPAQRRATESALVLALLALYVAFQLSSHDFGWIEHLNSGWENPPGSPLPRWAAILGTAVVPVALIGVGVHRRRALLLDLGLLLGVASLVTLRVYVHLAPPWLLLLGSGVALLGGALALRRYLARGPAAERAGFTAEPLFAEDRRAATAAAVATLATLSPSAAPSGSPEGFRGGGGEAGGGGASAEF